MNDIQNLRGVGEATTERLNILGISSRIDLLYHFPHAYDDFSNVVSVAAVHINTPVTVRVVLKKIKTRRAWRKRRMTITEATVEDHSGSIKVIWFNQSYIGEQLKAGEQLFLAGKITEDKYGRHFSNPIFERVKSDTIHTARIVPRYRLTQGLTQKQLRYYVKQVLEQIQRGQLRLPEWLPQELREHYDLIALPAALAEIHFPKDEAALAAARYRLGFDELLPMQLFVRRTKQALAREHAVPLPFPQEKIHTLVQHLPFILTDAQRKVAWQILQNLTREHPMNRLLEGDVGAGKTVIALLAMYQTVLAGFKALLMAPTELLAEQHFRTLTALVRHTPLKIALVTRNYRRIRRQGQDSYETFDNTMDADIIIGTHALLEEVVSLSNVAFVVIDEQHRFGVAQRQRLKERAGLDGKTPHLLSMTATPIPRSLALVMYGDLDLSILDELPPGRKPIETITIGPTQRRQLYSRVRKRIAAGEQAYIVAPRIRDDELVESDMASVERAYEQWKIHLPHSRVAMLHGELATKEKQRVMEQFRDGQIHCLVATTVIEVGVDVPNATVMVIENAERFGLAQLHQLRGRVGRSDKPSFCCVCCEDPSDLALKRLQFFTQHQNGFELAEYDLETRGPGDVYGEEQSGYLISLKIAKLSDQRLLHSVSQAADELLPELHRYPLIEHRVQAFVKSVHLE